MKDQSSKKRKQHNIANPCGELPHKPYFTINEVVAWCDVKPPMLRQWEQAFEDVVSEKRNGHQRFYRREVVLLIRIIRQLIIEKGYTISGAAESIKSGEWKKLLSTTNLSSEVPAAKKSPTVKKSPEPKVLIADLEEILETLA